MRGRSPLAALSASPTMVGAITTLIAVVAVFLAYNANAGLPFVPTYRVSVEVPNASRLGQNNEVRIGGNRVGVVESIEAVPAGGPAAGGETGTDAGGGTPAQSEEVVARLNLKLDKAAEPLPKDSIFHVRYRSSFGLKYLEITRGEGEPAPEGFQFIGTDDGELFTIEEARSSEGRENGVFIDQTEFDDIGNTFDAETRANARGNLQGFGDAFAGRGLALNQAFAALGPLFRNLEPVARVLAEPATRLDRFFPELADAARIVAPVAAQQVAMFSNIATAFNAITFDVDAYQETISEGVPTLETGIRVLPAQRAFLDDLADLSSRLRPGVAELPATLPTLNEALRVGRPVLIDGIPVARDLEDTFVELEKIVDQDQTLSTIERLGELFDETKVLAAHVVPAQTVCNYWNYWFTFLPEHLSERDQVGFNQRLAGVVPPQGNIYLNPDPLVFIPAEDNTPLSSYSGIQSDGKAGILPNPAENNVFKPHEMPIPHGPPYAEHGERGADNCLIGQSGYLLGDLRAKGQPASNPTIAVGEYPGNVGPTTLFYNQDSSRELRDTRVESRQP